MTRHALVVALSAALTLAATSFGQQGEDAPKPSDLAALGEALASSLVVVEYTVQPDNGELPDMNWSARSAFRFDPMAAQRVIDWDEQIKEERPAERAGYLLAPDRVVTSDLQIHPRFIARVAVRLGDDLVDAKIDGYAQDQRAVFLKLLRPVRGGTPLAFDGSKEGPYRAIWYREREGQWTIGVGGGGGSVTIAPDGRRLGHTAGEVLITDSAGVPVGLTFTAELPLEGGWKGGPDTWEIVTDGGMGSMLAELEGATNQSLPSVQLRFRSPRSSASSPYGYGGSSELTEWHGTGILVDDRTVVVLASFKPKTTARLEAIRVTGADGQVADATFAGTLRNYGCFLAELDEPMSGAVRFATAPITDTRHQLLLKAEVGVLGETRTAHFWRERIASFSMGWRRQIYPAVPPARASDFFGPGGTLPLNFLFTLDGELVAAPIGHREKVAVEDGRGRYGGWGGGASGMLAAAYLSGVVTGDRDANLDPENRPLTEAEENRLAWLGVELQPMNADLARVNDVVAQTSGGASGAIVTYVYPDSPAADAGLEPGDILLRLHVEGQPKPLEVSMEGGFYDLNFDQMWEMLPQIPAEYLDQMPKPWGSAENSLTRSLTDIGFGTPFTAEVFRGGDVMTRSFIVTEGPAHYESTTRLESEESGLTVRNLTYEVRRYFRVLPDGPGVIVSKVEPGSKAAVAGIYPLEMIMAVNDEPVHDVDELEAKLTAGGEFRLNIKRMTVGRIVQLTIDPASE
jgi:hypothetical protein